MRDITQLHPELQAKISQLYLLCVREGLILGIGECLRTVAEQDALYAQGRTTPGAIVTNARGSSYSSQHQWGIAFDFYKNVAGHAYDDDAFFARVGALAKSLGLGWGGDWISPVDRPHVYLPHWGDTPTPLKNQYGTPERFFATWTGAGAGKLTVDGYWGSATTRRLQEIIGTPVDGVVSNQYTGWQYVNPGLTTGWEWMPDPEQGGSPLIRAIQQRVGMREADQDGLIGTKTIKAIQTWLGTDPDGRLDAPSPCIKALQEWCNRQ